LVQRIARLAVGIAALLLLVTACSSSDNQPAVAPQTAQPTSVDVPAYRHVVVVMEENRGYDQIIGNADAAYENQLARGGVNFTHAYAEHHPSQPNYLEFFAGSSYVVQDDHCITHRLAKPSLGGQLRHAGKTFTSYADGLPQVGATTCRAGHYARYHNVPMAFADVPLAHVVPFAQFPHHDFAALPSVAWVTPDLAHDMHDGSISAGDSWLRHNLSSYADWARTHDSLLIVTFDEDNQHGSAPNHIPAILYGAHLQTGANPSPIDHHTLLALIEDAFDLRRLGSAASQTVPPIFTPASAAARRSQDKRPSPSTSASRRTVRKGPGG
jgi:phospholipase C